MHEERQTRGQLIERARYAPRAEAVQPKPVLTPLLPLLALVLVGLAFVLDIL